jgi:hypothetical protein
VVTANFPARSGKGVGDTLTLELYRPETVADAMSASQSGVAPPEPDGPSVEATIVGVERSYWTSLVENDYATFLPDGAVRHSPAFGERFSDELTGDPGVTAPYTNAYVRLRGGERDIPAFTEHFAEVTGRSDIDMWNMPERHRSTASSIDFEVWALRSLALVAAIAAAFLVGQAAARTAASGAAELAALEGAGLAQLGRARLATWPVALAATSGAIIGSVAAAVASNWFPIGTAAMYEPAPGLSIAPFTLSAVAIAAVAVSAGAAFASARIAARIPVGSLQRPSAATAAMLRAGAPVPVVTGTRYALERGVGNQALPARPTLIAVVAGVTGMVATLTFAASLHDASSNPQRWGETWQLVTPVGGGGQWFTDPDALRASYVDVDGVSDAAVVRNAVAEVGDDKIALWSYPADMAQRIVIIGGRLPRSSTEVLLGPTRARDLGVGVGDAVTLGGAGGQMQARVAGLGLTPAASHSNYDDSGWIGEEGFDILFGAPDTVGHTAMKEAGVLTWADDGVDTADLASQLAARATPQVSASRRSRLRCRARSTHSNVSALPQTLGCSGRARHRRYRTCVVQRYRTSTIRAGCAASHRADAGSDPPGHLHPSGRAGSRRTAGWRTTRHRARHSPVADCRCGDAGCLRCALVFRSCAAGGTLHRGRGVGARGPTSTPVLAPQRHRDAALGVVRPPRRTAAPPGPWAASAADEAVIGEGLRASPMTRSLGSPDRGIRGAESLVPTCPPISRAPEGELDWPELMNARSKAVFEEVARLAGAQLMGASVAMLLRATNGRDLPVTAIVAGIVANYPEFSRTRPYGASRTPAPRPGTAYWAAPARPGRHQPAP